MREHPQDLDLVLAERSGPGVGGEQLAAELREVRRDLPVVLLVDGDGEMAPVRAAQLGLAAVLAKPVSTAALTHALRRALGGAATGKQRRDHGAGPPAWR